MSQPKVTSPPQIKNDAKESTTMNGSAPLIRPNSLGDTTAENDGKMLSDAFVATADFRSLIESDDRTVVVGRRGTGKSALYIELQKHWKKDKKVVVLSFSPEDTEIIGFRSLLRPFSNSFNLARAVTKLLWKYTILMEMTNFISSNYKLSSHLERDDLLNQHLTRWNDSKGGYLTKCRHIAKQYLDPNSPEETVGDLPGNLELSQVEDKVLALFQKADRRVVVLMDRLDEGYESDAVGIGMIAGLTYAAIELNKRSQTIRPIIFLRDNIYRTLAKEDPDYSRNIEGQVIRLHWDWSQLLTLVTTRMKLSFNIVIEKDQRVWDKVTAGELQGREGFKKCLQFTLYRPRDLLSLLNEAFFCAARYSRNTAIIEDLDHAAKSISVARLEDLWKEYSKIFPSIQMITSSFKNGEPELLVGSAAKIIENHIELSEDDDNHEALAETRILQSSGLLQSLYSVGFIGTHDSSTSAFSFCHDGRTPDKGFDNSDKILIHPCYWLGLNLSRDALAPEEAEEINDEYDIVVQSVTPEIRKIKIGQTISQLEKIPTGREGAKDFELWCVDTLRIIFASHLINLELAPNGSSVQRRDILGTNRAGSDFWKRVHEDYKVRQVVFDAKNYSGLGPDEYRQLQSYLTGIHGKLGFIITRDEDEHMTGRELDWVREMHRSHSALIIKLPARYLCKLLQKLRNPEKHDAIDRLMFSLLDTYERSYLQLKTTYTRKPKKRKLA